MTVIDTKLRFLSLINFMEIFNPIGVLCLLHRLLQNLDLVKSRFNVLTRAFDNLDCYKRVVLDVSGKPYGRKMPPTQFLDNHIAVI